MRRICGIVALVASVLLVPLLRSMPAPYEGRMASALDADMINLLPGNAGGSAIPADLSSEVFLQNDRLKGARRLFQGEVLGSESVAITPDGVLITLDKFGYVRRARRKSGGDDLAYETIDEVPMYIGPGRPLGFHVVENGKALLVCDSLKGLMRVALADGAITVVANRISNSGEPINYANDLDVAWDGKVYFTSSTIESITRHPEGFYDTMRGYMMNLLAGEPVGKLLVWDPMRNEVRVLLDSLFFPNGVAVSRDGTYVLVVETNTCRVLKYWLKGGKRGTHEVMVDKLPGMPDGITRSSQGGYWISLVAPLSPLLKWLGPLPWVRQLLSHVVMGLMPYVTQPWGCAVRISAEGTIVDAVMDMDGEVVSSVSAVTESRDGQKLFLGNLQGDFVSVVRL